LPSASVGSWVGGRKAELHAELEALVDEHNTAEDGEETRIEAAYLRVTVMV